MRETTNLEAVKEVAKSFLYLPIEKVDSEIGYAMGILTHPFFESVHRPIPKELKENYDINTGEHFIGIGNILEDRKLLNYYIDLFEEKINDSKDVFDIVSLLRKQYRLAFIKYTLKLLSKEDFSNLLREAWIMSENPNGDVNVSLEMLIDWYKMADKRILMEEKDYQYYCELKKQPVITVYRGVSKGRNPMGLSWTDDYDKAIWFANRFGKGFVQKAEISPKRILAYINSRDEKEIVIDTTGLEVEIIEQK